MRFRSGPIEIHILPIYMTAPSRPRTLVPDVPPLCNSGLNSKSKNFELAANDSDMRSPVEPRSLASGLSNYWMTDFSKPADSVF